MLVRLEEPVILVDIYNKPISPLLKSGAQGQTKQKFYP